MKSLHLAECNFAEMVVVVWIIVFMLTTFYCPFKDDGVS